MCVSVCLCVYVFLCVCARARMWWKGDLCMHLCAHARVHGYVLWRGDSLRSSRVIIERLLPTFRMRDPIN